jgi:hypothetical protein
MFDLFLDVDGPTLTVLTTLPMAFWLSGEQLVEGDVGISKERKGLFVFRSGLLPNQDLEIGVMQL